MKKTRDPRPSLTPFTSLLAAATLGIVIVGIIRGAENAKTAVRADIAVEYAAPVTLSLTVGTKGTSGGGLLSARHSASGSVGLSVPETWQLREVRDGAVEAVAADAPTFGSRRYHLPPGMTASFVLRPVPSEILLHNPGGKPLLIQLRRIDLATGRVRDDRLLVQQRPTPLW